MAYKAQLVVYLLEGFISGSSSLDSLYVSVTGCCLLSFTVCPLLLSSSRSDRSEVSGCCGKGRAQIKLFISESCDLDKCMDKSVCPFKYDCLDLLSIKDSPLSTLEPDLDCLNLLAPARRRGKHRGKHGDVLLIFHRRPFRPTPRALFLSNLRSLSNKMDAVLNVMQTRRDHKVCLTYCFTETWLDPKHFRQRCDSTPLFTFQSGQVSCALAQEER